MSSDSTSTSTSTARSVKPTVFSTASSPVRSRTEMAMVLPVTSSSVKNTTLPMATIRNSMLPICSTKEAMNAYSRWVRVSQAELAKRLVDGLGHRDGVGARRHAHRVPAHVALRPRRRLLLQVVPAEPELREVVVGARARVDAAHVELPVAGEDRALDRDAVADLPAEAVGGGLAHHGALLVGQEGLPLVVGDQELAVHVPVRLGVDRELREEVLLVLVHAAEPVGAGRLLDARHAQDAVAVGDGQRLDQRDLVDDHMPVRPRGLTPW